MKRAVSWAVVQASGGAVGRDDAGIGVALGMGVSAAGVAGMEGDGEVVVVAVTRARFLGGILRGDARAGL